MFEKINTDKGLHNPKNRDSTMLWFLEFESGLFNVLCGEIQISRITQEYSLKVNCYAV